MVRLPSSDLEGRLKLFFSAFSPLWRPARHRRKSRSRGKIIAAILHPETRPEPEPAGQRIQQARNIALKCVIGLTCVVLGLAVCGCQEKAAPPAAAAAGMQAM